MVTAEEELTPITFKFTKYAEKLADEILGISSIQDEKDAFHLPPTSLSIQSIHPTIRIHHQKGKNMSIIDSPSKKSIGERLQHQISM